MSCDGGCSLLNVPRPPALGHAGPGSATSRSAEPPVPDQLQRVTPPRSRRLSMALGSFPSEARQANMPSAIYVKSRAHCHGVRDHVHVGKAPVARAFASLNHGPLLTVPAGKGV